MKIPIFGVLKRNDIKRVLLAVFERKPIAVPFLS